MNAANQRQGTWEAFDWKILSQLRSTVNESGLHSEPTRQMLNYIWSSDILCPEDIKNIMHLILKQSQQLLWQAHWQRLCEVSAHSPRQQGDPLLGVTVEQLMGTGPFQSVDAQLHLTPEVAAESMRLAREALQRVKTSPPSPSYLSVKQGRDESFASFVDRVTEAINLADMPTFMKGPLLRQCILENSNSYTKGILVTLPLDSSVETMLERMSWVPVGQQALLVEAIQAVGRDLVQAQSQAFAVLAPLRPPGATAPPKPATTTRRDFPCYRCGKPGHTRDQCRQRQVWCQNCQRGTHNNQRLSAVGKRETEREEPQRVDPNRSSCHLHDTPSRRNDQLLSADTVLQPTTRGSLSLDLATAVDTTLIDNRPQKIATHVRGLLIINGQSYGALLLGRSSGS
ncbi:uncharacterized protein LOC129734920 [Falco cherrug]|uniref:uncharacterized protein LOC129734920 n=1 Tax=Falco cherrug TaxID=345164 RepID=UPI002478670C|nr:uncharacterized protein LOC129734920 [Falco cherrug]